MQSPIYLKREMKYVALSRPASGSSTTYQPAIENIYNVAAGKGLRLLLFHLVMKKESLVESPGNYISSAQRMFGL